MKAYTKNLFFGLLCGLVALFPRKSSAQAITASDLSGFVLSAEGAPVEGAAVVAVHAESGTRATTTTRSNGQYTLTGLRPGGPYTIAVSANGYAPETRQNVFLELQETATQNFSLAPGALQMAPVIVQASQTDLSRLAKGGTGITLGEAEILSVPAIRRDLQEIAKTDPRFSITPNTSSGEFQLSAQGQNYRYNSVLVDGVQSGDPFGLNGNGYASFRSPVALDTLEAVSIELNPYDTRSSGFTGGQISARVKSGSNVFHGSGYIEYTNQQLRGKNALTQLREPFQERTKGFTLGGPILKNRLFFFIGYDDFVRGTPAGQVNFIPDQTVLDAIIAKAKSYNFDPGTNSASTSVFTEQQTYIAKLDWNIREGQRFDFSYRRVHSFQPFYNNLTGATSTSLSSNWNDSTRNTNNFSSHLFSTWTPSLRTEATVGFTAYDGSRANHSQLFPAVTVNGVPGKRVDTGAAVLGGISFGTGTGSQLNVLKPKETTGKLYAEYTIDRHTITVGGDIDRNQIRNEFVNGAVYGSYTFASPTDWQNGVIPATSTGSFTNNIALPGHTVGETYGVFTYLSYGAILQDTWRPNPALRVIAGLRLDDPYVAQKPPFSQAFFNAFGIANNTNNSGNYTLAPRFGFNYDVKGDHRVQLRGGLGLFQGASPAVWLSNAYSNDGVVGQVTLRNTAITFNPDPYTQTGQGTLPTPVYNVTDPKFRQPLAWKGNLAVDYKLPHGLVFTAEYNGLKTMEAPVLRHLNLGRAPAGVPATLPDGRIRYAGVITPSYTGTDAAGVTIPFSSSRAQVAANPAFSDVFYLTDVHEGYSNSWTLELRRPMKDHWSASLSAAGTRATEASPMVASVASSNYSLRAVFNPNEYPAGRSNYDQKLKIVASTSYELTLIKRFPTTLTAYFIGNSGHPYSFVFKGDANGDGYTNNDLFYAPSGPSDPMVTWNTPAERDAYFAWAGANGLSRFAGHVVSRNSESSNWINTLDVQVSQDIPLGWHLKAQLFAKCSNLGNLLNKNWGILTEQDFPYNLTVAGAKYNPAGNNGAGQYIYFFNNNTLGALKTLYDYSRWQAQIGARVRF